MLGLEALRGRRELLREYKFRGKRIDNGQWVYGDYFKTPLTDENSGTKPDAGWFFLTGETRHCISREGVVFVVDPETVGEYTGLRDKNGRNIYEGDILRLDDGDEPIETVVKSENGVLCADITELSWDYDLIAIGWIPSDLTIEVIGNLHDDPELLGTVTA
jgi:uncharacterized phage protein (TIGR01671 family)